jgi:hypothetical protein
MKFKKVLRVALAASVGVFAATGLTAQENAGSRNERRGISSASSQVYVISAEAGGVSYASGSVRVERAATNVAHVLAKSDQLAAGDRVSVGDTGRIEVLLNPGSFLRLAENTEFEFGDTSLESLQLKLKRGSALIEAIDVGDKDGAEMSVWTPQTELTLEKSGIYRLNVSHNATEVLVWKGAARFGSEIVKSGKRAVIHKGAPVAIAKFDKDDERDALDIWSRDRAKQLAKLNERLERRELSRMLRTSYSSGYFNSFNSRGVWLYNRYTGGICYVPFGWNSYYSPYGYGYYSNIYWGSYPVVLNTRQVISDDTPGFPNVRPTTKAGSFPAAGSAASNPDAKPSGKQP